jgi:hypothetical protein
MSEEPPKDLLARLQTEEVRFLYKLNWILIHVRKDNHPEHSKFLAIGWVSGYNAFYCNTSQLAGILNLDRDSVTKNFQHLGFRFVKKQKIPLSLGDRPGWRIRCHPDITTDCDESVICRIKWIRKVKKLPALEFSKVSRTYPLPEICATIFPIPAFPSAYNEVTPEVFSGNPSEKSSNDSLFQFGLSKRTSGSRSFDLGSPFCPSSPVELDQLPLEGFEEEQFQDVDGLA